jgi:hypothetical protein
MQWLETSKYTIFVILSKFQNLWKKNVLLKKIINYLFKCFPMIFQSLIGLRNQGMMVPRGNTQGIIKMCTKGSNKHCEGVPWIDSCVPKNLNHLNHSHFWSTPMYNEKKYHFISWIQSSLWWDSR